MNPILKKLFYKDQDPVLLLAAPPEFKAIAKAFVGKVHAIPKGSYGFLLGFAKDAAGMGEIAKTAKKALAEDGVFWMAYPKGTSKRYKAAINRDTIHEAMGKKGFDGVSLVALDEDWSAMRFKAKK